MAGGERLRYLSRRTSNGAHALLNNIKKPLCMGLFSNSNFMDNDRAQSDCVYY